MIQCKITDYLNRYLKFLTMMKHKNNPYSVS